MTKDIPQTIVVMGMHRSGTSALTGALTNAGINSGDQSTMYETDVYNEKGYFEQKEIIDINEAILVTDFLARFPELKNYGCHDTPADLYFMGWLFGAWLHKKDLVITETERNVRIKRFLEKLWNRDHAQNGFIIKDPRISLTFPVWEHYLGDPFIIIMVRHPAAVARSMLRRDTALYEALGYQLWIRYTWSAMQNSAGHKTMVIDYDRFVENPDGVINEVFIWLQQNGFRLCAPKPAEAAGFVSTQLRHNRSNHDVILPEDIQEFHENIMQACPSVPTEYLNRRHLDIHAYPWQSILFMLAKKSGRTKLEESEAQLILAENAHRRLVNHPVSGTAIKLLRRLKNDKTFGKLDYHCSGQSL